ncbi:hypothetical protein [Pueribacillus theae]|nr:hypothetical protein [Pueribacillus theae]
MPAKQALALLSFFAHFELKMLMQRRFRIAEYAGRQREKYYKIYLEGE